MKRRCMRSPHSTIETRSRGGRAGNRDPSHRSLEDASAAPPGAVAPTPRRGAAPARYPLHPIARAPPAEGTAARRRREPPQPHATSLCLLARRCHAPPTRRPGKGKRRKDERKRLPRTSPRRRDRTRLHIICPCQRGTLSRTKWSRRAHPARPQGLRDVNKF